MKFRLGMGVAALALAFALLVGTVGAVQALTNGECPTLEFRDRLFDAAFATDTDGWVVGYPGIVIHTKDAGKTWSRACKLSEQALFAIDFVGSDNGWVVGRAGKLIMTADAGKTWQQPKSLCEEPLFDVDFIDKEYGWAVGNFGRVLRTTDGGKTWISTVLEPMANASINAMYFFDRQHGFLVGEYPAWEAALDESVLLETLSNLFETHDGGATWKVVDAGTKFALNDIVFADKQNGWAVGAKGTLVRTTDGGATWTKVETGVTVNLFNAAVSPGAFWAVGTAGTLIKLTGDSVVKVDLNAYSWLAAVAFSKAGNGLVVGGRGLLFHTRNEGKTWDTLRAAH